MSDDRFSEEERAIQEAAKTQPPLPKLTPAPTPCRRYVDRPAVSAEEIAEFAEKLKENT